MGNKNLLIVLFLGFIFVASGVLFGQRVIDLDKVWGDVRVLGEHTDDTSGDAVASGDVNGDGYDDVIIGAWAAGPEGRNQAGETYVIFGSGSPPTTIDLCTQLPDILIFGDDEGDRSGRVVASGDINGDGYDDIIISAPWASLGGRTYAGKTYVIFGESFPSTPYTIDLETQSADISIYGADYKDYSGYAVASGDVNGDGFDDIIIGAHGADPGDPSRANAGETYVIFGFSIPWTVIIDLSTTPADITVCGDNDGDVSGYSLASGDVNGDLYDDVIIGAHYADPPGGTDAGKTYVIYGSSSPDSKIDLSTESADITVCGAAAEDYSGLAVASGNVNGDEYDDIIIGAAYADPPGGTDAGESYVVFGNDFSPPVVIDLNDVPSPADIIVYGDDADDISGRSVASGNINGDCYMDIIIGAPCADPLVGEKAGETYVIFGSSFPSPPYTIDLGTQSADITVYGDDEDDWSGWVVASGDINGDECDDIIIGAGWADTPGGSNAGETYMISGGGAFITAHGLGGKSWIKEFSLLARDRGSFKAFGAVNSQGEVHLAVGDVDADGLDEIAAGQGEGAKSWVKFFEVNGSLISTFKAFGAANTNGELHLAVGNLDVDTSDNEIAIAQGEGGQSWIKVFETDGTLITSIKAFGSANTQGEVHLAAGDLNNDGIDEIVASMGEGGVSTVKIFESIWGVLIRSFRAFDATDNPGGEVHLAVGNFDADADLEIAASTGYNGGNKVRLFDKDGTLIKQFLAFGFGGNPNGDVQIAGADIDNDGIDELICGHGEGGSSWIKVFKADGTFIRSFKAFGGVNAQGEVHLGKSNY